MVKKDKKLGNGGDIRIDDGAALRDAPGARPTMPIQSNAGGAMRGLERAAAMSGRDFTKGGNRPNPVTQPSPVTQPGPIPVRDIGFGNGPRGLPPKSPMSGTGQMVPVRGGGMAPASVATMMKKGGKVKSTKKMASGGKTSSASKRADGCAVKGKTKGRML